MAWEASVPASAVWATVRRTTVASIFEEATGGARHDLSADGIELVLQPNTEYRRTVVVTIAAADGTTADYEFTQLGQKADAAVTSETAQLVFMAAGGSETVTYTSNMGDAYAYEVVYEMCIRDSLYIEGLKDYVKIHVEEETHPVLTLTSLKSLEEQLPADRFVRVHRSFIVQPSKIRSIERNRIVFGKEYIPVSENYRQAFFDFLAEHSRLF